MSNSTSELSNHIGNSASLNDDIRFAIQIQANDNGIFDDELIDRLVEEFCKNNYDSTGDIIDDAFDMNGVLYNEDNDNNDDDYNYIDYTFNTVSHRVNMTELDTYRNLDLCEIINEREERRLRAQLHINQEVPMQNSGENFNDILHTMMNSINQGGPIPNIFTASINQGIPNIFSASINQGISNNYSASINQGAPNIFSSLLNVFNQPNLDPVRVTMTQDSLDKLEDMTYDQLKEKLPNLDKEEKCAICWSKLSEHIEDLQYYKVLPCNHAFHSECISIELINYSYLCPTCKTECGEHEAHIDDIGFDDVE